MGITACSIYSGHRNWPDFDEGCRIQLEKPITGMRPKPSRPAANVTGRDSPFAPRRKCIPIATKSLVVSDAGVSWTILWHRVRQIQLGLQYRILIAVVQTIFVYFLLSLYSELNTNDNQVQQTSESQLAYQLCSGPEAVAAEWEYATRFRVGGLRDNT